MAKKFRKVEICPNCRTRIQGFNYCPNCGQLRTDGMVSVWDFLKDAFEDVFNFNGRIFLSLKNLMIPGKLTRAFFDGKINSYYKPVRIFFVTMIIHFALLGITLNDLYDSQNFQQFGRASVTREQALELLDSVRDKYPWSGQQEQVLDTLTKEVRQRFGSSDSTDFSIAMQPIKIAFHDIYSGMSRDSMIKTYQLEGLNAILAPQLARLMRSPSDALRFAIGNLTWMILALIFALALVMKLLYIRRGRLYVEHLVFLFHNHAFGFLIFSINYIVNYFLDTDIFLGIASLLFAVYCFVAMSRYYRQRFFKTFVKSGILLLSYFVLFAIFVAITMLLSILLY